MILHLDTNTVIRLIKGDAVVRARWEAARTNGGLAISAVVLHELEVGLRKSVQAERQRLILSALFVQDGLQVVAFDDSAAAAAAHLRAVLEARGEGIGPLDSLIAGQALAAGATLVTHNVREFARVDGLQVIDWQAL